MKRKVFFRVWSFLILYVLMLLATLLMGSSDFTNYARLILLIIAILIGIFTDKRYISGFTINGERLEIIYINAFLKIKKDHFELNAITGAGISRQRKISFILPPELHVNFKGESKHYLVLTEALHHTIRHQLDASDLKLSKG
jgi:hypothetical protein